MAFAAELCHDSHAPCCLQRFTRRGDSAHSRYVIARVCKRAIIYVGLTNGFKERNHDVINDIKRQATGLIGTA